MRRVVVSAGLGGALAGCAMAGLGKAPPAASVSVSDIHSQVAPATGSIARAGPDVPHISYVRGWGLVLATPRVLASLSHELGSTPERDGAVAECRRQIELGAAQYGDVKVEAAGLGEGRRTDEGIYEKLVEIRVIYDFHAYYEVRQATVKCSFRPDGSIIDAEAVTVIG